VVVWRGDGGTASATGDRRAIGRAGLSGGGGRREERQWRKEEDGQQSHAQPNAGPVTC
jgi:hypothetical protein